MIHFFHGKNSFLSKREAQNAVEKIKKALGAKGTTYDFCVFDASEISANQIINEIETPSIFVTHKIIFIKRPSQSKEKEAFLEQITKLVDSKESSTDIIIWEDRKIPANTRLVKGLKKAKAISESPELNKRTFLTWAQEEAASAGIKISRSANHLLSERTNYNPERYVREIEKMKLFSDKGITETDIERICPDTLEHTIWELIDAINNSDGNKGRIYLNQLFRQGNDPFYVLFMIARNFRILLLTKILSEEGYTTADIAKKIKAHPFTINMIKRTAQNTSMERIKKIYDKLTNIDYSGKTGQLDVELALNILLCVI